jgi:hypothetical protein
MSAKKVRKLGEGLLQHSVSIMTGHLVANVNATLGELGCQDKKRQVLPEFCGGEGLDSHVFISFAFVGLRVS